VPLMWQLEGVHKVWIPNARPVPLKRSGLPANFETITFEHRLQAIPPLGCSIIVFQSVLTNDVSVHHHRDLRNALFESPTYAGKEADFVALPRFIFKVYRSLREERACGRIVAGITYLDETMLIRLVCVRLVLIYVLHVVAADVDPAFNVPRECSPRTV
ncbi:MAG: hypothetical protein ACI9KE_006323, partial [Polyangiales bacterium]